MKAAKVPNMIYGTAWKKDATVELVRQALSNGFRGVDTAAQPKHYREDLVGAGIRSFLASNTLKREDIYIQTKFTSIHGQDPANLPYDPKTSITEQVNTSVASSLTHLRPSEDAKEGAYIDCLVLHSPYPTFDETLQAWTAMESHVPKSARTLGISNIYHLPTLRRLHSEAKIKPSVVQNRFYRETAYDAGIRSFCTEQGIVYQSFWTLTANPHLLRSACVNFIVEQVGMSRPVALYSLVLGLGNISILNGTTQLENMKGDLTGIAAVRKWAESNLLVWQETQKDFEQQLG